MSHSHLCSRSPRLPFLTPGSVSSDRHRREKSLCSGASERKEMLSKGGRRSEEEESNRSTRAERPQSKGRETHGPFWQSRSASVQSSLHSWAPFTILKGFFIFIFFYFFLGWSAGCFTFRSLNKQEIKRTSNKMANRAPHITLLSWEAQCESF